MPLNKKLIHFNSKDNFMSAENGVNNSPETPTGEDGTYGNLKGTSIVFIKDSKEIGTHGNLYKSVNWSILEDLGGSWDYIFDSDNKLLHITITTNSKMLEIGQIIIDNVTFKNNNEELVSDLEYGLDEDILSDSYTREFAIGVETESSGIELDNLIIKTSYKNLSGWHDITIEC